MAVVYSLAVKNNRLDAVTKAIGSAGKLIIGTAGLNGSNGVLATIYLARQPFTSAANGSMTLNGLPLTATGSGSGSAARAEIRTGADELVITGLTVGVSGADINIGSTDIGAGNTVQVTSGTISHG